MTQRFNVYCNRNDLIVALRQAFQAGGGCPYELKKQEASRVMSELMERAVRRSKAETLKKYVRYAEDK